MESASESAFTLSSLREYTLGDFVAAIYEVDHLIYRGTVVKIGKSDNEVLVSFMEPSVLFKSNSQAFRCPKKPDEILAKKEFCVLLNSPSTRDKARSQSW